MSRLICLRLQGTKAQTPTAITPAGHVYNLYTLRTSKRDALRQALTDNQIGYSQCYPPRPALARRIQTPGLQTWQLAGVRARLH